MGRGHFAVVAWRADTGDHSAVAVLRPLTRYLRRSSKDQARPLFGEPDFFDHDTRAFFLIFRYELGQSERIGRASACKNNNSSIWGRANSVNVQKVLWCLRELDLSYRRIDAGMAFGKNNEPEYLAMNPNGRVPTLVDGDYVLWESNSVMRYLCMAYGKGSPIYPHAPKARAAVDRWLDWTLSTLQPVDRPVFWALVRTPPEKRDMVAIQKDADAEAVQWRIVDRASRDATLHRRRSVHHRRYRARRLCAALVRRRRHHQAEIAEPRALVRRVFRRGQGFVQFIAPPMS